MNGRGLLCSWCVTACLLASGAGAAEEDSVAVSRHLREMVTTAKQLLDLRTEEYRAGTTDYLAVLQAQRQLLALELRLAADRVERRAILKRQLNAARERENLLAERFKDGQEGPTAVLEARLERMEIELQLLEEEG